MCKCVSLLNKQLAPYNTQIAQAMLLNMKTGRTTYRLLIATEKLDPRKRMKAKQVLPTYCPFCGVRTVKDSETKRKARLTAPDGETNSEAR